MLNKHKGDLQWYKSLTECYVTSNDVMLLLFCENQLMGSKGEGEEIHTSHRQYDNFANLFCSQMVTKSTDHVKQTNLVLPNTVHIIL
jgi:hypothetical protein